MKTIRELFDLTDRVAVITGGAGFLGYQHARAILESGGRVTLWDLSIEKLNSAKLRLSEKFPNRVSIHEVNIADSSQVALAARSIDAEQGKVDILINNASMTLSQGEERFKNYFDPFETYPVGLWEMALNVNLTGTFIVTQSLISLLKKSKSASIINIASDVGVISPDHRIYQPNPERNYDGVHFNSPLSYATSKAALIHMTKYWATYWAKTGIRVNSISPAGVANDYPPQFVRELTERIPMGRMAYPHEYKGAIAFLASEASSFMTGANLIIDGGRTAW